jgi:hypothetical protein
MKKGKKKLPEDLDVRQLIVIKTFCAWYTWQISDEFSRSLQY